MMMGFAVANPTPSDQLR